MFSKITPTQQEVRQTLPGDDIVPGARIVMNRAMTLPAPAKAVWPWLQQMGKNRAGWYFTKRIEWLFVKGTRGIRYIDPNLQDLAIGKVIDDWGGKNETFEVALLNPEHWIVYTSIRRGTPISWAIVLKPVNNQTRVQFRLRIGSMKSSLVLKTFGDWFDGLTINWLRAGLTERLRKN